MKEVESVSNVKNRTLYTSDNLPVLRSMDSNTVDLIYLDPPFNTGRQWANPIGASGKKAIASFEDTWRLADIHVDEEYDLNLQYRGAGKLVNGLAEINGESWKAYLIYMGVRLAEMRRILKPTGTVYFHCDPTMSHGVKLLMDCIFGIKNFRNEIVWCYHAGGATKKYFPRKHDILLCYGKDSKKSSHNIIRVPYRDWDAHKADHPKAKLYHPEGKMLHDWWEIPQLSSLSKERTRYPTQKPLALLNRVVTASSNKGEMVLDPFCGCATACIAAENLNRNWIGIDLSETAAEIIYERLRKDVELPLANPKASVNHIYVNRHANLPNRTDLQGRRTDNAELLPRLYKQQGGRCLACKQETGIRLMDLDHIIAKSRGGQDVDENLQLLCRACNADKGSGSMEALRRKVQKRLLEEMMEKDRHKWQDDRKNALESGADD